MCAYQLNKQDVDGRDKPGHDARVSNENLRQITITRVPTFTRP